MSDRTLEILVLARLITELGALVERALAAGRTGVTQEEMNEVFDAADAADARWEAALGAAQADDAALEEEG